MQGLPKLVVIALEACHLQSSPPRCSAVDKQLFATTDFQKCQLYFLEPMCLAMCTCVASNDSTFVCHLESIAIGRPSKSKSPMASSLAEAAFENDFLVQLACLSQVLQGPDPFKPENGRRLIATS